MKHVILALALTAAAPLAQAQTEGTITRLCPTIANAGAIAAQGSAVGMSWERVSAPYQKMLDESTGPYDRKLNTVIMAVITEAYYKYPNFSSYDAKRLAYMKCELEFLKLMNDK